MNEMTRRVSPLSTVEKVTARNKTVPRNKSIGRLTPHHIAGNLTVESTLGLVKFHDGKSASTGYAIDTDGRMGLGVEETNRPWTSSSGTNDHQAITFEIANNGGAPDWRMSEAAINKFLDAAVEMCVFYGYKSVNYQAKPSTITGLTAVENWIATWAKDGEMIITLHNWYSATTCPGPYFMRQIPWLVREMNKRLQDPTWVPEAFIGEGGSEAVVNDSAANNKESSTTASSDDNGVPYLIRPKASALNVRSGPGTDNRVVKILVNDKNLYTITEETNGPGASKWGKLKSGLGWVSLDFVTKQ